MFGSWRQGTSRSSPASPENVAPAPLVSLMLNAAPEAGLTMARALGGRRGVARPLPPAPAAYDDERFVGTERRIALPGRALTVRLREGELRRGRHRTPLCQLFLDGDGESVGEAAIRLAQAGAGLPDAPAPPILALDTTQSTGEALASLIETLGALIRHHAAAAAIGDGLEPVHQMRVAVRRLRSAIGLFRRAAATAGLEAADGELKVLMQKLSPARDWDVFLAGAGAEVAAAFPDDAAVAGLLARARGARGEAYAALAAHLAGAQFRVMTVRLAWLAAARPWEMDHATLPDLIALARRMLERRWAKMLSGGEAIEALPVAALHGLRLHAKRMRYACEIFGPLFPGHGARRWVRRLARLQDRLGLLNDAVVASDLMQRLAPEGSGFAGGVVCGFVAADSRKARPRSLRAWRRLRRLEVFWD